MKSVRYFALSILCSISTANYAQAIDPAALYQDNCAICHGDQGNGKGHAQQSLVPPPRNFTSPKSALELTRERIIRSIEQGVPGSAMSGWKSRLSDDQIAALADFIRNRFMLPAASASPGGRIYAEYCSVCHGDRGQGAIWASEGLSPPPVNFSDPKIQKSLSRDHMIDAVTHGRAETAMTGWKSRLDEHQIGIVVDYVISTFMPDSDLARALSDPQYRQAADGHAGHDHTHFDIALPLPGQLQGDPERGARLYEDNCATCHGLEGDGRGPRAYFINPKPRNFLHTNSRASLNRPKLFEAISKGRLRTEMPAWEKVLTRQQIADVTEYVFNRFIKP